MDSAVGEEDQSRDSASERAQEIRDALLGAPHDRLLGRHHDGALQEGLVLDEDGDHLLPRGHVRVGEPELREQAVTPHEGRDGILQPVNHGVQRGRVRRGLDVEDDIDLDAQLACNADRIDRGVSIGVVKEGDLRHGQGAVTSPDQRGNQGRRNPGRECRFDPQSGKFFCEPAGR